MRKYVCSVCGFVYDEAIGIPEADVPAGTLWEQLPSGWRCPWCGAAKTDFSPQSTDDMPVKAAAKPVDVQPDMNGKFSPAALAALFTNLAKGCEKQDRSEEAGLFRELAAYYQNLGVQPATGSLAELAAINTRQLDSGFAAARALATEIADRGALRALTWSEKVARIQNAHLSQYGQNPEAAAAANVYVCEICGFIYFGGEAPEICPVCKVPRQKIAPIARR